MFQSRHFSDTPAGVKYDRLSKEDAILNNKRLIKTGTAAIVATVVFGFAAFKAAEWTNSYPTEASGPFIKVIPQIAAGSFDGGATKYSTIVEAVNIGNTDAVIEGTFYKEDGSPWPAAMSTNLESTTRFTGKIGTIKLPAGHVLILSGGATADTTPSFGLIGWGKITTNGNVSISTFFEVRDGKTGVLSSRIGIPASRPNLSNFLIPRVHNKTGLDVGFAIVNTGANPASITATLKDANGATLATRSIQMSANTHQALFAHQLFSLSNETDDTTYQYIVFNSNSPTFAAIALAFEGSTQTSFPVDPLN